MSQGISFIQSYVTFNAIYDAINKKVTGRYLRFGDGDFNLMEGKSDMLARPNPELQDELIKVVSSMKPSDFFAVNFHCKELKTLEEGMYGGVHEVPLHIAYYNIAKLLEKNPNCRRIYSTVALHHMLSQNPAHFTSLLRLIKSNGSSIILHSDSFDKEKLTTLFGAQQSISAPPKNSYDQKERIYSEFREKLKSFQDETNQKSNYIVCILALGCGGRAMVPTLEKLLEETKNNYFILDFGCPIDILMGQKDTRAWIELTNPNVDLVYQTI
jgi:hypothetical protein